MHECIPSVLVCEFSYWTLLGVDPEPGVTDQFLLTFMAYLLHAAYMDKNKI